MKSCHCVFNSQGKMVFVSFAGFPFPDTGKYLKGKSKVEAGEYLFEGQGTSNKEAVEDCKRQFKELTGKEVE